MYPNNQRGFTLVELLVVISIIGLLSSTVLAAVNSARVKADNAARLRMVEEYKKAFDLSYSEDGAYPAIPAGVTVCLGDYPTDTCVVGPVGNPSFIFSENPVVSFALGRFLSSRTPLKATFYNLFSTNYQQDGPMYASQCTPSCKYILKWTLEGEQQACGFGITSSSGTDPFGWQWNFFGITSCNLVLN